MEKLILDKLVNLAVQRGKIMERLDKHKSDENCKYDAKLHEMLEENSRLYYKVDILQECIFERLLEVKQ